MGELVNNGVGRDQCLGVSKKIDIGDVQCPKIRNFGQWPASMSVFDFSWKLIPANVQDFAKEDIGSAQCLKFPGKRD
jgi:hypothetical protein